MGCALDVRCPQRTISKCTVPACAAEPTAAKRRLADDSVGWRRGNLGHAPRLLHGVQVSAPVQLWKVSAVVRVHARIGNWRGQMGLLSLALILHCMATGPRLSCYGSRTGTPPSLDLQPLEMASSCTWWATLKSCVAASPTRRPCCSPHGAPAMRRSTLCRRRPPSFALSALFPLVL